MQDLFQTAFILLMISFVIFVTLSPLIVWSFCQEAKRPSWQLIFVFIFSALLLPLGVLVSIILILNIIITHKARTRTKINNRE